MKKSQIARMPGRGKKPRTEREFRELAILLRKNADSIDELASDMESVKMEYLLCEATRLFDPAMKFTEIVYRLRGDFERQKLEKKERGQKRVK